MKKVGWFVLLLLLNFHFGFSQTIYVSPDGKDRHDGSKRNPVASLERARDLARQLHRKDVSKPMTIFIKTGDYYPNRALELTSADSNLRFTSDPNKKAVFHGGFKITSFQKISDTLWLADVPETLISTRSFEQLFVNGDRLERAKFPNQGYYNPVAVTETILGKVEGERADSALQHIKVPGECVNILAALSEEEIRHTIIRFNHLWDNTIKPIQHFNRKDSTVTISGVQMQPWNRITVQSVFTLENLKSALDKPGEWYLENGNKLYYRPRVGEKIETCQFTAPFLEQLIIIRGDETAARPVKNITFENISFEHSAFHIPEGGFEPLQAAPFAPALVEADYSAHISFRNCAFQHTGSYAMWFRKSSHIDIRKNYFQDLGAGGLKIGETSLPADSTLVTHHVSIENNIFHSGGRILSCGVGIIVFHGHHNRIVHNEIADFRYTGISCGWVWGYQKSPSHHNLIADNHIHHLGWAEMSDMGGIYLLGISPGTEVRNNRIHDIYALDYGGWGIYTDEGSSHILVRDNLVYRCKNAGFHQHYGRDNLITNNIFAYNIKAQLQATRVETTHSFTFRNNIVSYTGTDLLMGPWEKVRMVSDSNCYWNQDGTVLFKKEQLKGWQTRNRDIHSVIENPGFLKPEADDFRFDHRVLARKIGFKYFDYTQAGVYGSRAWRDRAKLDQRIRRDFELVVNRNEALKK
ncbi:hypothetical protein DYBT9275_01601 [Dyadobacter sp. CECT 9275]|uniref:Right-handed parallel beta-helix repeat-containing protein n=1 Tax=Dyadobacter helix TaxID=2822344 RepID=A0A916J9Q0_9BACT|nr:right-handed parallel beta-helix repeat-containing protein [Dyadobacter sp. CECT 9275]CAG4995293.1 hypothetical protein DYBT9275_01601 [Dyadobacter sp. CECT 9275]